MSEFQFKYQLCIGFWWMMFQANNPKAVPAAQVSFQKAESSMRRPWRRVEVLNPTDIFSNGLVNYQLREWRRYSQPEFSVQRNKTLALFGNSPILVC